MEQEQKQCVELKLGEQLTGLSPTVCRRAIYELRLADKTLGGEDRTLRLPTYCFALILFLEKQTGVHTMNLSSYNGDNHRSLDNFLEQCEGFLDTVEGVYLDCGHIPPEDDILNRVFNKNDVPPLTPRAIRMLAKKTEP